MNKTIETIMNRQSIRKFQDKRVGSVEIREILTAAMSAPSACNQQPWHFVVLDDRTKLNILSSMHSGIKYLENAPMAIVVCGEPMATTLEYFWTDDCAAATQNILIAVQALGLGATWSGVNQKDPKMIDFIQNVVGVPKEYIPYSIVAIGYPDESRLLESRFQPEKICYNGWDTKWNVSDIYC
jgi:nitroreductase